ncbi:RC-LH1 core complex protein PufX [Shimia ponticola]|uniref:RC-LH1 core complex protein PufX n=1 Tax=Shimia ponticola TaxID=2582893 RepID=UPI0011BE1CFF|nr:RC-LH1 core complex protein PufX [Shimia ponticola]
MADENNNMLGMSDTQRLRMDILGLMLKGASYAALLVIGAWLFVYVFVIIGWFLPEDSKFAPDPTPLGSVIELVDTKTYA